MAPEKKLTRKRTRNPENWKVNKTKALTVKGKAHTNWKGQFIPEKTIKKTKDCAVKCRFKCASKIQDETRQELFDDYHNLSSEQQRYFILNTTACNPVQRRTTTTAEKRRNQFSFFLKFIFE